MLSRGWERLPGLGYRLQYATHYLNLSCAKENQLLVAIHVHVIVCRVPVYGYRPPSPPIPIFFPVIMEESRVNNILAERLALSSETNRVNNKELPKKKNGAKSADLIFFWTRNIFPHPCSISPDTGIAHILCTKGALELCNCFFQSPVARQQFPRCRRCNSCSETYGTLGEFILLQTGAILWHGVLLFALKTFADWLSFIRAKIIIIQRCVAGY